MGEKVEGAKNEGEKKVADAGKNVDGRPTALIFRIEWHCWGCARKITKALKRFQGVEQVKTDVEANKLTVTGKVDAAALKARLEEKIKKVDLVSPQQAKKEGGGGRAGGGDKKKDDGAGAKKDDKKAATGGGEKKDGGGDKKKEKKGRKKQAAPRGEKKDDDGDKKEATPGGKKKEKKEEEKEAARCD